MFRFLLWTSALWLTIVVLLFASRFTGAFKQSSSLLNDYQCTPQPCWHGIYPSTTSLSEAESIIRSDKSLAISRMSDKALPSRLCWKMSSSKLEGGCLFRSENAGSLDWYFPKSPFHDGPLTFGEAITIFGSPTGMRVCYDISTEHHIYISLLFDGPIRVIGSSYDLAKFNRQIKLDSPVSSISYNTVRNSAILEWKGFVPIPQIYYC